MLKWNVMNIFRYELLGNENLIMYEYSVKITLEYFKSSLTTDDKLVRKFNSPNDKLKKPNKNVININIIISTSSGHHCTNYMNTEVMNFTSKVNHLHRFSWRWLIDRAMNRLIFWSILLIEIGKFLQNFSGFKINIDVAVKQSIFRIESCFCYK